MKKRLSNEKGITIITVTLMIVVMIVILSVVTFYATNSVGVEQFQNMKADIEEIEAKAYYYYLDHGVLPVNYNVELSADEIVGQKNQNDSDKYYLVNKEVLGVYSTAYQTDYYINERTLTVYAKDPVTIKGKSYSRSNESFDKVVGVNESPNWEIAKSAMGYPYSTEVFSYTDVEGGCIISGFTNPSGIGTELIIPQYTKDGKPIIGIKPGLFTETTIPNTTDVYIMSNIKDIEPATFSTSHINNLYLNNKGTIGADNFSNWKVNGKVWIGKDVVIPDKDMAKGIFANNSIKVLYCESNSIGTYAFYNNSQMTTVILSDSLESVGAYAFYQGYLIEKIYRVSDVTAFGADYFPTTYKDIGSNINVHLPEGLKRIGNSAFYECQNLKGTLDLYTDCPDLESIGTSNAFYHTKFDEVNLKKGISYNRNWFLRIDNARPTINEI